MNGIDGTRRRPTQASDEYDNEIDGRLLDDNQEPMGNYDGYDGKNHASRGASDGCNGHYERINDACNGHDGVVHNDACIAYANRSVCVPLSDDDVIRRQRQLGNPSGAAGAGTGADAYVIGKHAAYTDEKDAREHVNMHVNMIDDTSAVTMTLMPNACHSDRYHDASFIPVSAMPSYMSAMNAYPTGKHAGCRSPRSSRSSHTISPRDRDGDSEPTDTDTGRRVGRHVGQRVGQRVGRRVGRRYEALPIAFWERSARCREAKAAHMERIDRLCGCRERLAYLTTLWNKETVLEPNMFPCKYMYDS
jgi:hypothetical protein